MDLLTIIGIVSVFFTGSSEATGVLPDDIHAAVGGTVMFNTSLTQTETPNTITWSKGNEIIIITSTPEANKTNPQYADRITLFRSTGSLELRNVADNDSGTYRVNILLPGANTKIGSTSLGVHDPITGAKLTISSEDLLEFNSSVTLSCSVSSGSSLSFLWRNISSDISDSDKVQISDAGANLTILNVTRYDQGPFTCTVFNPVSQDVSGPQTLSISYGPDYVDLQISPSEEYFDKGSNIRVNCSSDSRPPARLQWFLNDTMLPYTGPELLLSSVTEEQSGHYSCQAFNSKTLRYKTSRTAAVTVLEKITAASIDASTKLPIEGKRMNLSCDSAGSVYSRSWMKDSSALTPDDNMMLDHDNRTLSFTSVRTTDDGVYSCTQSNPIQSSRVDYTMVVNFGPEQVTITGPAEVDVQESVTLTCTAASTPASSFTWTVNGTVKEYSSVFTINEAKRSDSGSYVCEARNNVTEKTLKATHQLSVTEISPCSSGCIAAIVVVSLVVVIAAVVGGFYLCKRRKRQNKPSSRGGIEGENNQAFAESQSQDLNYAELSFYQKANGESVQFGLSDNSTEYAEVRVNKTPPTYDAHVKRTKNRAPLPGSAHASS